MIQVEGFKNLAAGVQSLVLSVGLLVGGIWTIYKFALVEDFVALEIEIEATPLTHESAGRRAVLVEVTVRNKGTRQVELDLSGQPLLLQKLGRHSSGELIAEETLAPRCYVSLSDVPSIRQLRSSQGVQPGTSKTIPFYQELDSPGTYLITFCSPVSEGLLPELNDPKFDPEAAAKRQGARYEGRQWTTSTYVLIR